MDKDLARTARLRTALSVTAFGIATLFVMAGTVFAQGPRLEGVWGVTIQRVDCTTNAPLGPQVRALLTVQQGGTLTESSGATAFAPGQRSIGHGIWSSAGGLTYSDRTATLLLFDTPANTPPGSPGFQAGWEVTSHTITLSTADSFTATGTAQFYDLNRAAYRAACTSRSGTRVR